MLVTSLNKQESHVQRVLRRIWALSIQPKIPEISVGSSNGTDHWVWPIVAGRGSKVAVAGPMSRSQVQSRGRGSNVAAGDNDLGFEVTAEWKRLTWTQYKGKKSFLSTILYGSQFTGYGCESQQNNVSRKDLKEKAGRLLCSPQVYFVFFLSGPVKCKFSFEYTYA